MIDDTGTVLGAGTVVQEDSSDHIPRMEDLWLRHDIWNVSCSTSSCSWYTGTGTPSANELDAWGVWQEETGHVQNMLHWDEGDCTFVMSGDACEGDTSKRNITDHVMWHACDPYRRTHDSC